MVPSRIPQLWFHSLPVMSIGMRTIVKCLLYHAVNRKVSVVVHVLENKPLLVGDGQEQNS